MTKTALDKWEPRGEPIHPYDLFKVLDKGQEASPFTKWCELVEACPPPADEADYLRNLQKIGNVVEFNGKLYFETSTIVPVTKASEL